MRRVVLCLLLGALLLMLGWTTTEASSRRIALVIGNSDYQQASKLANPRNDATDMAATLTKLGFKVIEGLDLDKAGMDRKVRDFALALAGADVGLLFYAGHGLQVGGQNYLAPVDARLMTASTIDFELVRLDLVQRTMEREAKTNIIFLDACRDNPLVRNLARAMGTRSGEIGRGLAIVESGIGTLISFSTQPGNIALDGEGRNSPFAGSLVRRLGVLGEDLTSILIGVRNDVMKATNRRQVPWEHSALTDRFYFSASPTSTLTQLDIAYWASVKDSADPAIIQTYLDRFPNGEFASLARALMQKRQAEVARKAEDERKRMLDEKRRAEAARKADDLRRAEEAKRAAEARRIEEALKADALRKTMEVEQKRAAADQQRKTQEESKKQQEERKKIAANSQPAPVPRGDTSALPASFQMEGYWSGNWGRNAATVVIKGNSVFRYRHSGKIVTLTQSSVSANSARFGNDKFTIVMTLVSQGIASVHWRHVDGRAKTITMTKN